MALVGADLCVRPSMTDAPTGPTLIRHGCAMPPSPWKGEGYGWAILAFPTQGGRCPRRGRMRVGIVGCIRLRRAAEDSRPYGVSRWRFAGAKAMPLCWERSHIGGVPLIRPSVPTGAPSPRRRLLLAISENLSAAPGEKIPGPLIFCAGQGPVFRAKKFPHPPPKQGGRAGSFPQMWKNGQK